MIPIGHRGFWWPDRLTQNTLPAIASAGPRNYGIELDVRLSAQGTLYLAHDSTGAGIPVDHPEMCAALQHIPLIMWDIKDTRVVQPLMTFLARNHLLHTALLFDLEIVEPGWEWHGLVEDIHPAASYLRRASDQQESLFDALMDTRASGVWLDAWEREWVDEATIRLVHETGKRAYVCSSELHRRAIRPDLWRRWATADGIVTDFPHLLASLVVDRKPELHPAGWHAAAHQ